MRLDLDSGGVGWTRGMAGHPAATAAVAVADPAESREPVGHTRVAVEHVSVRYGAIRALDDVSLDVAEGEIVCLLGPSGSGKSTLLRTIAGIDRPLSGRIAIDGREVAGPHRFVEPEHRCVGMVFQDYALFPHLTIEANVAFGLTGRPRADMRRVVGELLARLDLQRYAGSYPHMLSGGERQRVALARALAPEPRVLLMDEPFSGLDDRLRDRIRRQTVELLRDTGTTTIIVTHDPDEAMYVADRIALLHQGRLVQCGPPDQLYAHPATLFAARFFSDVNEIEGVCRSGRVETPVGIFPAPGRADNVPVAVCIRPQHVRLSSARSAGIPARVLATTFLGASDQLVLAVDGLETPVIARASGRTRLEPGDCVRVDLPVAEVMVLPRETVDSALQPIIGV
jgi:iron(III) transport system ATP-binding protein